jgi:tRNA threonylcarbamoyladenosine biosynthesis protein TsaE
MKVVSHSPEETLKLGEILGSQLVPGDIVLLFGDLGAGKTTFTQGITRGLGMAKNEYIRSPTFTLINEYQARVPIYHIDLYRMDNTQDIESLGLEEVLFGEGVAIVEWAEKLFPKTGRPAPIGLELIERLEVKISPQHETERSFEFRMVNMGSRRLPNFSLQ